MAWLRPFGSRPAFALNASRRAISSGMQQMRPTNGRLVVRYPTAMLIIVPTVPLVVSAIGLRYAVVGRGHWTFQTVGIVAALGLCFALYVLMYRTVFSGDTVEQRVFPGVVRRLRYVDIQRVQLTWEGHGQILLLASTDGRRVKVYGPLDQLAQAQELIFDRVPQAFGG
jgi:hypothetical protein